ncbi:heavy metal transporter [Streptomyces sp. WAC06614]|uniref:heavy metal transporter n=1 Tax=Streptomyces sp. WAC06614 TaxID=2487416 RepID=UPI000F7A19BA|nr:heavy metal transporter [Streptomyces sp. WAC06614]RSS78686.1 heavy metal transporter [Streptomyces sp. WAC06614]
MFRLVLALAVLAGVAGYFAVQYDSTGGGAPHCTVEAGGASYAMTPEQAGHAATIAAVGTDRGMPQRAATIAIATAIQESHLRNLDHGDRDSLGLFQQRPSMGWGTPQQIMDPVYAAAKFYEHLAEVDGYENMPLTVAAQEVQRSGYPEAYAKHEADAQLLAAAFTGNAPATMTCSGPGPQRPGDPEAVKAQLVKVFGPKVAPRTGSAAGTHGQAVGGSDGAEIALSVQERRRGWELAHWAVANASELGVERVSYDGVAWLAGQNRGAWVRKAPGRGGSDDPRNAGPHDVRIFVKR